MTSASVTMPLSLRAESEATSVSTDVRRDDELQAAWQSIFEKSHSVEMERQPSTSIPQGDGLIARRPITRVAPETAASGNSSVRSTGDSVDTRTVAAVPVRETTGIEAALSIQPSAVIMSSGGVRQAHDDVNAAPVRRATPITLPLRVSEVQPASAVLVSVTGSKVSIVVREAAMADEDALRCAFETARELAGTSAGLSRLTVNGRELYRRQEISADLTAQRLFFG